jgi:hypothetical protein
VKIRHLLLIIAFHFISAQFSASILGLGVHILLHVTSSSHIDLVRTSFTTQMPSSRRVESHSLFIIRNLCVKSSHHQFPPTALISPQLQFATASVFNHPLFLHLNFLRIVPLKLSLHSSKLAPLSYFYCSSISRLQSHTVTNFSFGISLLLLLNTDLDLAYLQVRSRSIFLHIPPHPRASVISLSTCSVLFLNNLFNTTTPGYHKRESSLLDHPDHLTPP